MEFLLSYDLVLQKAKITEIIDAFVHFVLECDILNQSPA
jgi:hypothetical protein